MRVIDYTNTLTPMKGVNVQHRNPVFYNGPERADFVLAFDYQIIKDYREKGIPEWAGEIKPVAVKTVIPEKRETTLPDRDWETGFLC